MGWIGLKLNDGWSLFTRGGLNGIFITHEDNDDFRIEIPDEMLIGLAADTIRSARISAIEGAGDEEILGL